MRLVVRFLAAIALLVVAGLSLPRPAAAWKFLHAGVDSTGGAPGQFSSLIIDRVGRLHASYYRFNSSSEGSRNLIYATKPSSTTGSWTRTTVDATASTGSYSSISLTRDNVPHIAYYESEFANLKHAWYDSSLASWRTEVVDVIGTVGLYTSIAVDTINGTVNILYHDATKPGLKLARKPVGGLWAFSYVDTLGLCGLYASAVFSGVLEVAYYELLAGNLRYARQTGSTWTIETVDAPGDVGRFASLAKIGGRKVIAYYDKTNQRLKVAESLVGGGWSTTPLDATGDPGQGVSIAVTPNSRRPGITYYASATGDLRYAERFNGTWLFDTIATGGDVGRFSALRYDAFDLPVFLYYDDSQGKLRSARGVGETTGVPGERPPGGGPEPGLALAPGGNPFRETCPLALSLPAAAAVTLKIFDVTGRLVRRIETGRLDAGTHRLAWDGRDAAGQPAGNGVYFVRAEAGGAGVTARVTRIR